MAQKYLKGAVATVHRIDLPCDQTGFTTPPFDVHIKFLPNVAPLAGWTLLAHAAAGKPDALSRWLAKHPGIADIRVEPGLAPKLLRATATRLPTAWAAVASFVRVQHLDLSSDGHASWFIQGERSQVLALVNDLEERQDLPLAATEVRCRPVHERRAAPISRRQFEALATAVAMGYYDIPHRLDLRALAAQTGLSLGSLSELLRRAEAAVLTHYVDAALMAWPADDDPPNPFKPVGDLLEPTVLARGSDRSRHSRPASGPPASAAWPLTRR